MRTILLSALALGGLISAAVAEPVELLDTQMDGITAGKTDKTYGVLSGDEFNALWYCCYATKKEAIEAAGDFFLDVRKFNL